MSDATVAYRDRKYVQVPNGDTDTTQGVIVPNGELVSVYQFKANGADPKAYVRLVWDHGGGAEKIFASTRGDIDREFDLTDTNNHVTGDGVKVMKIIITNDNMSLSPVIGGEFSLVKFG